MTVSYLEYRLKYYFFVFFTKLQLNHFKYVIISILSITYHCITDSIYIKKLLYNNIKNE